MTQCMLLICLLLSFMPFLLLKSPSFRSHPVQQMPLAPDSESAFEELGRHSAMSNFALNGWKTCGSLALAVPGGPGRDEDLFRPSVVKVLVDDAQKHLASSLSRLHFKSYTIEIADLRRRTERSSRDQPRKLPNSEKEERRHKVVMRLPGLKIAGKCYLAMCHIERATWSKITC